MATKPPKPRDAPFIALTGATIFLNSSAKYFRNIYSNCAAFDSPDIRSLLNFSLDVLPKILLVFTVIMYIRVCFFDEKRPLTIWNTVCILVLIATVGWYIFIHASFLRFVD